MFKKADLFLALILIVLCGGAAFAAGFGGEGGSQVRVTVGGETYGVYSLYEDREIIIEENDHYNKIFIKGGAVCMADSDCAGKQCQQQGKVSRINQPIVCLPNQVVVTVEGQGAEVDAVL
ncbi:MAG: NusG domain II-containing protein [Bacillota bacterium]|nr:NusG domain II-containing protein [Bacillota bacterium]